MFFEFCVGKIHCATVTDANLHYKGSITIDAKLVEAAGFFEGQMVHVNCRDTGIHWETYIMKGVAGKGDICLNGPPANIFKKGQVVVILAYGLIGARDARDCRPTVVHVDGNNQITEVIKGLAFD